MSTHGSYSSGPGARGRSSYAASSRSSSQSPYVRRTRGGRGRERGRGRKRGGKPTAFQEYNCTNLADLSKLMNQDSSFYNFSKRSIYSEVSVQENREKCLRSMVTHDQQSGVNDSVVIAPEDMTIKIEELNGSGKTEKAFSNCWYLNGSFFENLSFYG